MVLPCRNQAKLRGFALRFKCPDQSRAPGRKSQFRLEPEKTFSANFWEVEQAGFRKLPSRGRGVSAAAEEVALALCLSSQTRNYSWPWAPSQPLQPPPRSLEAVPELFLPSLAEQDGLERVLPRSGVPVAAGALASAAQPSQKPNTPSLQTQLLSKLGSMALGMAAGPTANI